MTKDELTKSVHDMIGNMTAWIDAGLGDSPIYAVGAFVRERTANLVQWLLAEEARLEEARTGPQATPKPGNYSVVVRDSTDRVLCVDFGISDWAFDVYSDCSVMIAVKGNAPFSLHQIRQMINHLNHDTSRSR